MASFPKVTRRISNRYYRAVPCEKVLSTKKENRSLGSVLVMLGNELLHADVVDPGSVCAARYATIFPIAELNSVRTCRDR